MAIIPSHKNSMTYLEHCKVLCSDTKLCFQKTETGVEKTFALPHANSNFLLLGPGTSITQQAARLLAEEGVCIGFCAGGGAPLFLTSSSEYRPTEFMQAWARMWLEPAKRLEVAKFLQVTRIKNIKEQYGRKYFSGCVDNILEEYHQHIVVAKDTQDILLSEARFCKLIYRFVSSQLGFDFQREPRAGDMANHFLDNANYVAYGFASCALWVLGISYSFGVVHGKTRRGALVFDIADTFKDAYSLPVALEGAYQKQSESDNRVAVLDAFDQAKILKKTLLLLQEICEKTK